MSVLLLYPHIRKFPRKRRRRKLRMRMRMDATLTTAAPMQGAGLWGHATWLAIYPSLRG